MPGYGGFKPKAILNQKEGD